MLRRFTVMLACALGLFVPIAGRAQATGGADSTNVILAKRLLQAMHYDENVLAALDAGMVQQRAHSTQLAPVFYDSALARMRRSLPQMLDSIAPIYARRLSGAELEAATKFFESPAGQALARQQPTLNAEAMAVGQRWGVRVGAEVAKDLVDAGIKITAE